MKYLLDTTTYGQLVKGHQKVAEVVKKAETLYLPNVVMAELRYGFKLGTRIEENELLLNRFVANKKVAVVLPDNATTDYFVNIAVFARNKGIQLSTHDIWIAALSIQWGATLQTFDGDFKNLDYPDLKLQYEQTKAN